MSSKDCCTAINFFFKAYSFYLNISICWSFSASLDMEFSCIFSLDFSFSRVCTLWVNCCRSLAAVASYDLTLTCYWLGLLYFCLVVWILLILIYSFLLLLMTTFLEGLLLLFMFCVEITLVEREGEAFRDYYRKAIRAFFYSRSF